MNLTSCPYVSKVNERITDPSTALDVDAFSHSGYVRRWILSSIVPDKVTSSYDPYSCSKKEIDDPSQFRVDVTLQTDASSSSGTTSPGEAFDAFLRSMDVDGQRPGAADDPDASDAADGAPPSGVPVFHVSYATVPERREAPNPEHERWKRLPEAQRAGAEEPPPTVATVERTRKMVTEEVNRVHRAVTSLYLTAKDRARLDTCLGSFVEKKPLLRRLGLPNKLCVLLHGTPGCGKTSTAAAIATYLRRPMYYVALKTLQTDAELREAFRAATADDRTGGVIVLEDVDAMTDLVRDRLSPPQGPPGQTEATPRKQEDAGSSSSSGSEHLTLSCLLNLLQGTLTLDNMVVVATTNHLSHLDPALVRDGRFDVRIELRPCDRRQVADMYLAFTGRTLDDALLARVPEHVHAPATVMGHLLQYAIGGVGDGGDEAALQPFLTFSPTCSPS
jgi:hypothetical protein